MGALKQALPNKVLAHSCGCIYSFASGVNIKTHPHGGEVALPRQRWGEVVPSGWGAGSEKDGNSVMSCHVTNVPLPPIESLEVEAPVLYLTRDFNTDSAGPGKHRGGFGILIKWQTLAEGTSTRFNFTAQKHAVKPKGFFGGLAGRSGKWVINEGRPNETVLQYSIGDTYPLKNGDTMTLYAVGGGGYGDPMERDPELVAKDVLHGLISLSNAFQDYAVVINPSDLCVDKNETLKEKQRRKASVKEKDNQN